MNKAIVERKSNFELLRIISMLLVLIVHADFFSLGEPTTTETISAPLSSFTRYFVESISIICVNIFILISGYFGIRLKKEKVFSFLFQVFFINFSIHILCKLLGGEYNRGIGDYISIVLLLNYWFVRAYLILMLLSPILNTFLINSNKKTILYFLCTFYALQTLYIFHQDNYFRFGYSPLSFIGLYIIGYYIKNYPNKFTTLKKRYDLLIYILISLFISIVEMIKTRFDFMDSFMSYAYSSPLIVTSSIYFFLFFSKLNINNRFINWIASSAFAIYLVHCHENIFSFYYAKNIKTWFETQDSLHFILYTTLWILFFFIISILFDKIRIFIWNYIKSKPIIHLKSV